MSVQVDETESTTRSRPFLTDTPDTRADRFVRWLLRVPNVGGNEEVGAHRAFQTSLVVSGIRCLITYLLVPIVIPAVSVAGLLVAPLSIALCLFAAVSGTISLRRFWRSNHKGRWLYTWFMLVVYLVLIVSIVTDVVKLIGAL